MSGVFRNIDPHSLTARRVCIPPPLVRGKDTLAGWRGVGGSIVRKTPDTALYSIYVSTLWCKVLYNESFPHRHGRTIKSINKSIKSCIHYMDSILYTGNIISKVCTIYQLYMYVQSYCIHTVTHISTV
jgi:hypothetical protein